MATKKNKLIVDNKELQSRYQMKRLLPILFLLPSAAFADMTSTITSSVQIEVMSAATAADRVANSYSVSGSGVTTTDGTTAGVVGGLGTATNGVNAFTTITASQSTAGENFQFTQLVGRRCGTK